MDRLRIGGQGRGQERCDTTFRELLNDSFQPGAHDVVSHRAVQMEINQPRRHPIGQGVEELTIGREPFGFAPYLQQAVAPDQQIAIGDDVLRCEYLAAQDRLEGRHLVHHECTSPDTSLLAANNHPQPESNTATFICQAWEKWGSWWHAKVGNFPPRVKDSPHRLSRIRHKVCLDFTTDKLHNL